MDFLVREASAQDARAIATFQIAMARETEHRELDAETVIAGVTGVLQNPKHGFYLVATEQKTVVASLLLTFEWSDWRNGVFWWIQSVYVGPNWRRRGIFRALFAEVKRRAQEDEAVRGLRLYVERDNAEAQMVYARLGLSETPYRICEVEF